MGGVVYDNKTPLVCYTGYYAPGGNPIEIPYTNFVYRKLLPYVLLLPRLKLRGNLSDS